MDIRVQHARHEDRFGLLVTAYLEELEDWFWVWGIADMSTQPGKANPTAIIDPGNWRYGLGVGEPPNVDGLIRGDDPDPPPTDPADMPESASVLPPAGQTTFTQTVDEVTIHFGEAPNDPDGYWIFGLGDREHSQAVGPTEQSVVLRQNNGTGDPYDPETLGNWPGTPWFCVKAFKDAEVSLEQACNTYNFTPPVGPPPDPTGFAFTAPSFDRFRYNADLEEADGVELELAPDVGGSPGTFDVVAGGPGDDQVTQGQLPYPVTGQPAETTKHGRIRSFNLVDLAREYSNYAGPLSATTPAMPAPGSRPNLPGDFTDLMFQHDCSQWPVGKQNTINATGFGRIIPHSNEWNNNNDGNDGGTFTGAIEAARYATSGPAGHPHVEHGPLAPHGQAFCHRIRYSRGGGTGTATGGGSQCDYRMPAGSPNELFRAIYMHFWVLFEGFDYDGAVSGPTRVIQGGSQYRFGFQKNNCPQSTNQGGLLALGGLAGTINWGVSADTGNAAQTWGARLTHAPIGLNLGSACRNTLNNCSNPLPGPTGVPGSGAPGNGLSGNMWTWAVGGPGNQFNHNSSTRVANNTIEIGRWHRFELILRHSDVNTENGSLRVFVDGTLRGVADPITTRWSNTGFDACGVANGWYRNPSWYRGFHPGGNEDNPNQLADNTHNRYASFADFYYAGILV